MRLDLIDEGLAELVEAAPPDRRAHAAVAAAALAVERAGIDDPLTRDALEGLDRGEPDPSLRPRLLELAQTFDERCWELEGAPDEHNRTPESRAAFAAARAVAAVQYALDPADAYEAIYEAYHAVEDGDDVLAAVRAALG
jgi:hypothetical protein